jgi:hypothetical protein
MRTSQLPAKQERGKNRKTDNVSLAKGGRGKKVTTIGLKTKPVVK